MSYIPVCKYCGQMLQTNKEFENEHTAEEYASRMCNCRDAIAARQREEAISFAKARVEQLFGEDAAECGFEAVTDENILCLLNLAVVIIAQDLVTGITVNIRNGGKAIISAASDGKIRVKRSITHACQLE